MTRLKNRVAVITGGISGIGRATAELFADQGAQVVVADIHADRGIRAAREMSSDARNIEFIQVDVTSQESQGTLFDEVITRYGRVDTVVAAAGISSANYVSGEVSTPSEDPEENFLYQRPLEDWHKVLQVNLTGVLLTNQLAVQHMLRLNIPGSIINLASIAGRRPLPGAGDYCVSKAGVIMLTQVMAAEMAAQNIRINAIGPGFIETPMTASIRQSPMWQEVMIGMTPMQRLGQASEIAETALFLASDQSSYFTGETLFPSGGMYVG